MRGDRSAYCRRKLERHAQVLLLLVADDVGKRLRGDWPNAVGGAVGHLHFKRKRLSRLHDVELRVVREAPFQELLGQLESRLQRRAPKDHRDQPHSVSRCGRREIETGAAKIARLQAISAVHVTDEVIRVSQHDLAISYGNERVSRVAQHLVLLEQLAGEDRQIVR